MQRFYRPAEAPRAQVRERHAQGLRAHQCEPCAAERPHGGLSTTFNTAGIHRRVFAKKRGLAYLNFFKGRARKASHDAFELSEDGSDELAPGLPGDAAISSLM